MINKERIAKEFMTLVGISSPSRRERQLADYLLDKIKKIGFEVYEDDVAKRIDKATAGNIIVNIKGNIPGKRVLFSAHMDCVQPCEGVKPQFKDGIFTSDGTTVLGSDDKCAVAALIEVMQVIKERKIIHSDLQIIFTVVEEEGLEGAKYIDKGELNSEIGYILDVDGNPGTIVTAAPGYHEITSIVRGKKAHAGIEPEKGINAISVAAKAIAQLPQGRIDEETTVNIGMITGGTARNIVADYVRIDSEARSINMEKLSKLSSHIAQTTQQVCEEYGGIAEVTIKELSPPVLLSEEDEVVVIAKRAVQDLGLPVNLRITGASSDGNFFNVHGIPSVVLATGMSKVHTTEEFLKAEDLYATAEIVLSIIKNTIE